MTIAPMNALGFLAGGRFTGDLGPILRQRLEVERLFLILRLAVVVESGNFQPRIVHGKPGGPDDRGDTGGGQIEIGQRR